MTPHQEQPVVAIVGSQHGNEPLGSQVVAALNARIDEHPGVIGLVGNPRALEVGERYVESNMNQAYHGGADTYESRRAQKILKITKYCTYLFDIHSTTANIGPTFIISDLTERTLAIINVLPVTRIVYFDTQLSRNSLIGSRVGSVTFEINTSEADRQCDSLTEMFLTATADLASGKRHVPIERELFYSSQQIPIDIEIPFDAKDFEPITGVQYRAFLLSEQAYDGRRKGFQLTAPIKVMI